MVLDRISFKYENFISLIILFSTLTSYAIIPTSPATVPCYLLILVFILLFVFFPRDSVRYRKTFYQFTLFGLIYCCYTFITQMSNWIFPVRIPQNVLMVDPNSSRLLFRGTFFTQSAYLIVNVFFYYLIRNYPDKKYINSILWAFRALTIYAIYEFLYYLIFGSSGDFISNRIFTFATEADAIGSSFQLQYIGPTTLLRIKGFVGEPSMYAFVMLPYLALLLGLKKTNEALLVVVSLILTFSTTAYIGLGILVIYYMIFSPNKKLRKVLTITLGVIVSSFVILWATNEIFQQLIDVIFISKLSGESVSGDQRSGFFIAAFNFWRSSDLLHVLFGYGFGYSRSTDFFSTLLFNVGLLGFISFTVFIFSHFLIRIEDKLLRVNYRAAVLLIYITMLMAVPEFAYTSIWVLLASGYILKDQTAEVSHRYNM